MEFFPRARQNDVDELNEVSSSSTRRRTASISGSTGSDDDDGLTEAGRTEITEAVDTATVYTWEKTTLDGTSTSTSTVRAQSASTYDRSAEDIHFLSMTSGRRWTERKFTFTDESPSFIEILSWDPLNPGDRPDPCLKVPHLRRCKISPSTPKHDRYSFWLTDILDFEFDSLMWGLRPKLGVEIPLERLIPMLVLSTRWKINSLREYAIQEIPKRDGFGTLPIPKQILLGRRGEVNEWLLKPYKQLAVRLHPLQMKEAQGLGWEVTLAVCAAREKVLQRRFSLVTQSSQSFLKDKWPWIHSGCWNTLTSAWKRVLAGDVVLETDKRSDGSGSEKEMDSLTELYKCMQTSLAWCATVSPKNPYAQTLCYGCRDSKKIKEWLNLEKDEEVAERALKKSLGESHFDSPLLK